jgi:dipeptidyl aminopeptidase/acylaminoacyl peptidase
MPGATSGYEKVEFKTIDGEVIRGWFYRTAGEAPAIIMTPGVSALRFSCL